MTYCIGIPRTVNIYWRGIPIQYDELCCGIQRGYIGFIALGYFVQCGGIPRMGGIPQGKVFFPNSLLVFHEGMILRIFIFVAQKQQNFQL